MTKRPGQRPYSIQQMDLMLIKAAARNTDCLAMGALSDNRGLPPAAGGLSVVRRFHHPFPGGGGDERGAGQSARSQSAGRPGNAVFRATLANQDHFGVQAGGEIVGGGRGGVRHYRRGHPALGRLEYS